MTEQILQSAMIICGVMVIVAKSTAEPAHWIKVAILTPLIISAAVIPITAMVLIWQ